MKAASAHSHSGIDSTIRLLSVIIMGMLLTLSPMALNAIGWNYDGLGGAGPTRFHPAMYLTAVTFLLIALRDGNPLLSILTSFGQDARVTLFLAIWLIVFAHGVVNQQLPAAGLIDTYLLPLLLLLNLRRLDQGCHLVMARVIHVVMAINAAVGVAEFVTGLRLTPYVAGGVLITDDWRSTALLGHPLGNALMTGCYIMILMLGGARELAGWRRNATLALQFAGMVAFGGRTSLALLVLFVAYMLVEHFLRFLAGKKVSLRRIATIAVLVPVLIAGLGVLFELGVFDRFIMRFVDDNDSANARIKMFELFQWFSIDELLLGPQQVQLAYLVRVYKLEFGIESVWIAFSLYYGILPTILFFTGLLLFLWSLVDDCQKRAWIIIGYFFLVNTTFLGIAGKSINFANLCLMCFLLLPAPWRQARRHVNPDRQPVQQAGLPC